MVHSSAERNLDGPSAFHVLRASRLFGELPVHAISVLAKAVRVRRFDAGETVVRAGVAQKEVIYQVSGRLLLYRHNPKRKIGLLLGITSGPALVGDAECAAGVPWAISVRTSEPSMCLFIRNGAFLACVQKHASLAYGLYRDASLRHLLANLTAQTMALYPIQTRLIRLLLDYVRAFGLFEKDGSAIIEQSVTRVELAGALGVSEKTVTRALQILQRSGVITRPRGTGSLQVHDVERLRRDIPGDMLGLASSLEMETMGPLGLVRGTR